MYKDQITTGHLFCRVGCQTYDLLLADHSYNQSHRMFKFVKNLWRTIQVNIKHENENRLAVRKVQFKLKHHKL